MAQVLASEQQTCRESSARAEEFAEWSGPIGGVGDKTGIGTGPDPKGP